MKRLLIIVISTFFIMSCTNNFYYDNIDDPIKDRIYRQQIKKNEIKLRESSPDYIRCRRCYTYSTEVQYPE